MATARGMQPLRMMKKLRHALPLPLTSFFDNQSGMRKDRVGGWVRSRVVMPLQKAWGSFVLRLRFRKRGHGFRNLYDDVQACGYEDVQVMWSMLNHQT